MKRWNRALTTLIGAAAAGALVWFVPHFDRASTGGYWAATGFFAAAGMLLGVAQLHGRDGSPRAMFFVVFVPVLIAVGWVLIGTEPGGDWFVNHIRSWSGDMGIAHAVHNLGEHVAVLVFTLGLIFGLTFEPAMIRRRRTATTAVVEPVPAASAAVADLHPADEPAVVESAELAPELPAKPTDTIPPR